MVNINDIMITSLEEIHVFDLTGTKWICTLDELQNATISNTEEKEDIVGKKGRKLTSMKKNKAATISATNAVLCGGMLAVQLGSDIENGANTVRWTETLVVNKEIKEGKTIFFATTNWAAVGTTGNEIKEVYVKDATTGAITKTLTQDAQVSEGKFTYTPDSKTITFYPGDTANSTPIPADVSDGDEIVVHYDRKVDVARIKNMSDKYSGKCMLIVDALGEDRCANMYRVQFEIPKADFSGEFDLEIGDSQTMHSISAECQAGFCGAGGELWSYTVFGANAADA